MKNNNFCFKILTSALLLCALLQPQIASAYDFMVDGLCYNKNSDSTSVTLTYQNSSLPRYTSISSNLVIPGSVTYSGKTYSVTSIGNSAFNGCSGLTSVTIPNSVTSIGNSAFYGCSGLTSVNISDIASWCGIHFGVANANPLYYAHNLYLNGQLVQDLTIPNSVTSISNYAFYGCSGLTSVTIPNSVTSIGNGAFHGCSGLTSVTIPNSVTSIGGSAFSGCSGLTSVTIPNSVTSIGDYAFYSCSGLTSVTIPNSVTSIGTSAFSGCTGLTSVTIPNSVTSIGFYAFEGCSGLTSVTIPNSVTSIGYKAFEGCSGLIDLYSYIEKPSEVILGDYVFRNVPTSTCLLHVPVGSIPNYQAADGWNAFSNIVEMRFVSCDDVTCNNYCNYDLVINLANNYQITALQFDLVIPAEINTDDISVQLLSSRLSESDDHTVTTRTHADGTIRVIVYSINSEPFVGNEGPLLTITAKAGNEIGVFSVSLTNIELTEIDGKATLCPDANITVTVNQGAILATSLALDQNTAEMTIGETLQLLATILPEDANDKTVTWTSSNTAVATVDVNGLVTAVAPGTATITATTNDGSELSANCEVIVSSAILLGDVNGDGQVTVSDVVLTAQKAVGMSPSLFVNEAAGDVNGDGQITVADVVLIANIAVGAANAPRHAPATIIDANDRLTASALDLEAGNTQTIELALDNTTVFTAFQMDLRLPEGVEVVDVQLSDRAAGHALLVNETNGVTRVMGFSMGNKVITGNEGTLLNVTLRANNDAAVDAIEVKDVLMVERDGTTHQLDDLMLTNALTSVNSVKATARIYGQNSAIVIDAPVSGVAQIAMPNGMTRTIKVQSGHNVVIMQHGLYIVRMGDTVAKIII